MGSAYKILWVVVLLTACAPVQPEPMQKELIDSADIVYADEPELVESTEVPKLDAKILTFMETELVDVHVDAEDPDGDPLTVTYSGQLDSEGRWQTTYGNAGSYPITITVSDGEFSEVDKIVLVVTKKEEPPTILEIEPRLTNVQIDEGQEQVFGVRAEDLNGDPVEYEWIIDGSSVGTERTVTFAPSFNDAGEHTVEVVVRDATAAALQKWIVAVMNVNRPPSIEVLPDITVKETETVEIDVVAFDPDNDEIIMSISDPIGNDAVWQTTYDDAGTYEVVVRVSDGELENEQQFTVIVQNVNRPPVIHNIVKG